MILPSPLQVEQVARVCIVPKIVCWLRITVPLPLQVGHVSEPPSPSAPLPWHWSHGTYFLSLNFFSTPVEISFNVSFTFTRRSLPRYRRCCEPPPPPNPLKPPNPPPRPPKMSPNMEKISSIDIPSPPKPPNGPPLPAAPLTPAWPNWS